MLLIMETFTAILGIALLFEEAVKKRFANYATSIFLLCFVPLLCVYPVIARIVVGGAYSVVPGSEAVIRDTYVYVIYQIFCICLLFFIVIARPKSVTTYPLPDWWQKYQASNMEMGMFLALLAFGIYLYVYATGLTVMQVFAASRFEWFTSAEYSPLSFVASTYFLAISPVALLIALSNRNHGWAVIVIILLLIFYGVLAKDRKWLIYIISAAIAFSYILNRFSIIVRKWAIMLGMLSVIALVFWQVARGVIFNYYLTGSGDVVYESQKVALNLLTKGDLPYYYNASITAIDMNLNFDFSIPFGLLRRQLLFFLPANFSFGLKVEDISALFSDAIGGEDATRRGNMPPGLFGLFAISFGWIGGVISCSLIPFALRALDRLIHRSRGIASIVVQAHLLSSVMLLLRGDDSSATYFIISSLLLFCVVRPSILLRRSLRQPASAP